MRERGWVPYVVVYVSLLLLIEAERWLPAEATVGLFTARILVPGALLAHSLRRGHFRELRGFRPNAGTFAGDVLFGLAAAAAWCAPYLWIASLPRPAPGAGFDPALADDSLRLAAIALRAIGFAGITPVVEELFVRSFLMRGAELVSIGRRGVRIDERRDFRDIPIGRFTPWSFLVTVAYFTFSHEPWEWPVAATVGIAYNLWLYHRRHLGSLVLVHAVTNAALLGFVFLASGRLGDGRGGALDLWFFL